MLSHERQDARTLLLQASMTTLPIPIHAPHRASSTIPMNAAPAVTVILVAILTFPSSIFYLAGTTSMAIGALVAATLILIMRAIGILGVRTLHSFGRDLAIASVVIALLVAHFTAALLMADEVDYTKALGSLIVAAIIIAACGTVGSFFNQVNDRSIKYATWIAVAIFLASAIFSLIGIQPPSSAASAKPIFPFTEPSHFAGALLPILAFMSITGRGWTRWVWIFVGFALGFFLENLSLVIGTVVVAVACLSMMRLVALGALAVLLLPLLDLSYFIDRVQFDTIANTNLSALVYIQGWELVEVAFQKTVGWGLGFQQLGYTYLNAPTSELIYRLTGGTDLNLKEGSFVAAKLICELGLFGVLLILLHLYFATRAFLSIRRIATTDYERPFSEILALCSIYTYIIDMYVRGVGYFSSPTILMIASFFLLWRARQTKIE